MRQIQNIWEQLNDLESEIETPKKTWFEKVKDKIRLGLFFIIFFPAFIMLIGAIVRHAEKRREEKRYKKIIKKGFLWDTEYLVEKD